MYEYRCDDGHDYEKTEGFDAPTTQRCLRCGAPARRRISVPAVIFKGSGFYSTDNRRGWTGGNGSSSSDSAASKDGHSHEDGAPSGSEPKVEAKAD